MIAAPAAADAIARARRMPDLGVGLHVVLVDGVALSDPETAADLVGPDGVFAANQVPLAFRCALRPAVRRQMAREIRAQFEAFAATGLDLDHVDSHRHMHLHPLIARMIVDIGRDHGLRAMRVPEEPPIAFEPVAPLRGVERWFLAPWLRSLRRLSARAGIVVNDRIFGLSWSGAVTEHRILHLLSHLPDGVSELYLHPAVETTAALAREMPGYRHVEEYRALVSAAVRRRLDECAVRPTRYRDLRTDTHRTEVLEERAGSSPASRTARS